MAKYVTLTGEEVSAFLRHVEAEIRHYETVLPLADKPKEAWWRDPEIVEEFTNKLAFWKTLKRKLERDEVRHAESCICPECNNCLGEG